MLMAEVGVEAQEVPRELDEQEQDRSFLQDEWKGTFEYVME
jgi:hypothetical protein